MPDQDRIEVHLWQRRAAIFQLRPWHDGEALEQGFGLGPPVRFGNPDHDLAPVLLRLSRGLQHGKGLSYARATCRRRSFSFPRAAFASSRLMRARISSGLHAPVGHVVQSKTTA